MWKGIYIYISCHSVCVAECLWYHVKPFIYIYIYTYIFITCQSVCDIVRMPSCCDVMIFFDILKDLERPWGTLRDREGPWETLMIFLEGLRDPECPWMSLRDREGPERPWGTWETLRKHEKLFERTFRKPWGNLRNSFGKITWETLRELERLWGNWKNYIWGKPLSNGSVERFWYIFGRLQFAGSKSPKHSESWEWFCPHLLGWEKFHSHMYVYIYMYKLCVYIYIYIVK